MSDIENRINKLSKTLHALKCRLMKGWLDKYIKYQNQKKLEEEKKKQEGNVHTLDYGEFNKKPDYEQIEKDAHTIDYREFNRPKYEKGATLNYREFNRPKYEKGTTLDYREFNKKPDYKQMEKEARTIDYSKFNKKKRR